MRVVFMGTPAFAVPSLEALARAHDVCLVVTRKDAVRARGKQLVASPVKEAALALGLDVTEANRIDEETFARIEALAPDVVCVAAYGCILSDALLALPRYGCINVHASLLPRWRGAAPVQRAILAGDTELGVSIMQMGSALDAGAYAAQVSVEAGDAGAEELLTVLAEAGAEALLETLEDIEDGSVVWTEQDETLVTYAPKLEKAELALSPELSARELVARVRASGDATPARCKLGNKPVRVLEVRLPETTAVLATSEVHEAKNTIPDVEVSEVATSGTAPVQPTSDPSTFSQSALALIGSRVLMACADGVVELLRVRPDGKRDMDAASFVRGLHTNALRWESL